MVDCTQLMDRVRWIKTDEEVALIRRAADLLDDAYLEVFRRIRPGDTERKVHADMMGTCLRLGFEWAHGILNAFKNTVPYGGESDMVIEKGDAIRTDYVAYLHSYPGHQSRTVIVGEPTAEQRRDYAINLEVHRKTIDRCRAGANVHDLWRDCMGEYRKARLARPPHADRPRRRRLVAPAGADPAPEERASSSRKAWCSPSSRT